MPLLHSLVVHDAIQKADLEDAEAMKRFASQKDKSERFIRDNLDKQVGSDIVV